MINTNKKFDFLIGDLLSQAVEEYKLTEQYSLNKEKLEIIKSDCSIMFTKDEQKFALECFELILAVARQEEEYVYRKGFQDCVWLLKTLGVL